MRYYNSLTVEQKERLKEFRPEVGDTMTLVEFAMGRPSRSEDSEKGRRVCYEGVGLTEAEFATHDCTLPAEDRRADIYLLYQGETVRQITYRFRTPYRAYSTTPEAETASPGREREHNTYLRPGAEK